MATVAGDLIEITCSHPQLGNIAFYPKSGESFTMDLGGFKTEDEAQSITGSGEAIYKMNQARWSVEGVIRCDLNTNQDLQKVQALSSSAFEGDWTFTHVSGAIYSGKGKPVGDVQGDSNEGTMTLKVSGGGGLSQQ